MMLIDTMKVCFKCCLVYDLQSDQGVLVLARDV